jgi:hypothetical protein
VSLEMKIFVVGFCPNSQCIIIRAEWSGISGSGEKQNIIGSISKEQ